MRIENLEVGQVIKNYKELCAVLGIEARTGKGRILNHKEFDRYFKYNKQGQKYIITNIYDNPKEKEDNRKNNKGGNNRVYCDDIEKMILHILCNQDKDTKVIDFSTNQLLLAINMINENYKVGRTRVPKLSEILELPTEMIYEFYNSTNTELKRKVERTLNKMQRQSLIKWSKSVNIQKHINILDKNELGEVVGIIGKRVEHREATDAEKQLILKIERATLDDMGLNDKRAVFLQGRWNTFKKEVEKKLKERNTNIEYYYDTYKIIFDPLYIPTYLDNVENYDIKEVGESLNKKVVKGLKVGHTKKYNNAKDKDVTLFDIYQDRIPTRSKDNYVEISNKLVDNLIFEGAKDITNRLREEKLDKDKQMTIEDMYSTTLEQRLDNIVPF